jgi:chromosome partitioning protein
VAALSVAFINFKGGVGKTADVVHLGACLAKDHGKRVLVVDLDAQCNASLWLLNPQQWREHVAGGRRSVYQIFADFLEGKHRFEWEEAILCGVPRTGEGLPKLPGLHLLPSVVHMLEIEERLGKRPPPDFFRPLAEALRPVVKEYDVILLDCPPNLHAISKNALFFARFFVIPYVPDFLSLSGFEVFVSLMERFQDEVAGFRVTGRGKVAAVIINRYRRLGRAADQALSQLKLVMDLAKSAKKIHEKARILEPAIRDHPDVGASSGIHLPVTLYRPRSPVARDFSLLAHEFVRHFSELT